MTEHKKTTKNFWTFFIRNYRITYILLFAIVLFGVFSVFNIPKESSPEVDIPVVVVTTVLPGASAIDVEELVTDEIESKIQGLDEIDSLTSVSSQGFSQVVVSFDVDSNSRDKLSDVRERVDRAKSELPEDAGDPTVQKVSFSDSPVLTMALNGPFEPAQLKGYAESLEGEIEKIAAVSEVKIVGSPERQIQVVVRENALSQFGVIVGQITSGIAAANSDIPIGSIESSGNIYTVRLNGRLFDVENVRNTAIANSLGTAVFIRDIAEVKDTYSKLGTITRLSTGETQSLPSVSLQVFKLSGQGDILSIVDEIQEIIVSAQEDFLPEEVSIEIVKDDAKSIRADLSNLLTSGFLTILIVVLVLIVFLGWKEALLASLVVPLTFLITFIFLAQLGYTINFLTLFSLILALGILVDASIVVTESMFSNMEKGQSPYDAVVSTIQEFQKPLISGTLTTVFVFLPMLLMSGIMGKFIESIPVTVTIVLLSAIFVSLAIITTLGVQFLKPKRDGGEHGLKSLRKLIQKLYLWYGVKIAYVIGHAKAGRRFLYVMVILFVLSLSLPVIGVVKVNMFPSAPADIIYIDIENPVGTPLEITNSQIQDIERVLVEDERIESFLVTVGSGSNAGSVGGGQDNGNKGSIVVNLLDDIDLTSLELISEYERMFFDLVDADVVVSQAATGPESGEPVQVRVVGNNIEDLELVSNDVADLLSEISGVRNVSNGLDEGSGDLLITVNRAQARKFDVSPVQIAGLLRTAITGETATVIKNNGSDIEVRVVYDVGYKFAQVGNVPKVSVPELNSILVPTNKGTVPLSTFSEINLTNSRSSISHDEGDRIVNVSSGIEEGVNARGVVSSLQQKLKSYPLPEGMSFAYGGEAENIAESFASLGRAMLLGMFLIFGLLLWQFNSYRQPLFILTTIPLALIGVLSGLALMNQPLSFPGFIGVVALAGIVVNNAIILVDSINSNRKSGMKIEEAVVYSAKSRLQPILLTTITTVAGLLPLAFSSPTWAPVALSIIFGLLFSTVLTLFVIPILYAKFAEKELS
jgi:HAE1 family hydrophobic/amphiphilic exporter-1